MPIPVTEEFVAINGARLWTARQGSGPGMALCHGGAGMWDYLGPVASMVADLVTVHRYDQRACGRSSGEGPFTVAGCVDDLDELRAYWGYERWIVGGHSWGASLALAYCLTYPARALALIYISGTGITLAGSRSTRRRSGGVWAPGGMPRWSR